MEEAVEMSDADEDGRDEDSEYDQDEDPENAHASRKVPEVATWRPGLELLFSPDQTLWREQ